MSQPLILKDLRKILTFLKILEGLMRLDLNENRNYAETYKVLNEVDDPFYPRRPILPHHPLRFKPEACIESENWILRNAAKLPSN